MEKEKIEVLLLAYVLGGSIKGSDLTKHGIASWTMLELEEEGYLEYYRSHDNWDISNKGFDAINHWAETFKKEKKEVKLATTSFKNSSVGLGWLDSVMPLNASVEAKETQIDAKKIWRRRS